MKNLCLGKDHHIEMKVLRLKDMAHQRLELLLLSKIAKKPKVNKPTQTFSKSKWKKLKFTKTPCHSFNKHLKKKVMI